MSEDLRGSLDPRAGEKIEKTRPNITAWILAGVIACLFIWLYWGSINYLTFMWSELEDYSYGFLIPVVVVYLVWERREHVKKAALSPSWWGLPVVLFAGVTLIAAMIGDIRSADRISLLLGIYGLVLLNLGLGIMRVLSFPLAFLAFAIPLPGPLHNSVTLPLALISSNLSTKMMRLFEISVHREGNIIDLGMLQLQVVEACSGLRFVIPLLALGVLMAYFGQRRLWKRLVLVLSTIPLSILANAFRIAATGMLAEGYGSEVAHGFFHGVSAWLVFAFAFGVLYLESIALNRIGPRGSENSPMQETPRRSEFGDSSREPMGRIVPPQSIAAIVVLVLCLFVSQRVTFSHATALKKSLGTFPMQIGEYSGRSLAMDPEMVRATGADDYVLADYRRGADPTITLYVAYYKRQGIYDSSLAHNPNACLPGSGWQLSEQRVTEIPVAGLDGPLQVHRLVAQKYARDHLVFYWYYQRGIQVVGGYGDKVSQIFAAISKRRSDGALVRLTTLLAPWEKPADAEERLARFIEASLPVLSEYLPD